MTTTQLQYFLDAAQTLNLSVSANRLYISQPTLGRHITSLEQELNTRLFQRSNNGLELTPAGKYFVARAESFLRQLEETSHQLRAFSPDAQRYLRIGLLEDQQVVPQLTLALRRFLLEHGECSLEIIRDTYHNLATRIEQGDLDLAQTILYHGAPNGIFEVMPLTTEPIHFAAQQSLVALPSHPINEQQLFHIIADCPVISVSPRVYPDEILPYLPAMGATRPRYVDYMSSVAAHVVCGVAGTFTNQYNLLSLHDGIRMVEITDMPPIIQGLIWRKENQDHYRIALTDMLKSVL